MRTTTKLLLSVFVVATLGSFSALGIFAGFAGVTSNDGNEISTGNVALSDNDTGSAMYSLTGAAPGTSVTKCTKVTYTGTLPATVALYANSIVAGALEPYIDITITQGTQASSTFPSCTDFTPTSGGGVLFTGTLRSLLTDHAGQATGIATAPSGTNWAQGDSLVYQVQVTVDAAAPAAAQGLATGPHSFAWEARDA